MPKQLQLKGAYMNGSGMTIDKKKGAKTINLNFTMKWSSKIAKELGWTEPTAGQTMAKLAGGMAVHTFMFEAGGKSFNLGSGLFESFQVFRMEEEGKAAKFELRGQYTTHLPGILGIAEKYVDHTSRVEGELHLQYEKIKTGEEDEEGEQFSLTEGGE